MRQQSMHDKHEFNARSCKFVGPTNARSQVRIDRRATVGPTLLKLVQPCWPEVGPTSEMITLSVH